MQWQEACENHNLKNRNFNLFMNSRDVGADAPTRGAIKSGARHWK